MYYINVDGLYLELEFVLVTDRYIQYDVLLGQNLFEIPGIKVSITKDQSIISRASYNINFLQKPDIDLLKNLTLRSKIIYQKY